MNTISICSNRPEVEAVLLFGSKARGDWDLSSDIDFATFIHAKSVEQLGQVKEEICQRLTTPPVNLSAYSISTAELMAVRGSLFLWHLKLEGKILFQRSRWIDTLLERLAPYGKEGAQRDLETFETVLNDIGSSLEKTDLTVLFEAATLFSVLRNVGMIVASLTGSPCFGRLDPILRTKQLMGAEFPLAGGDVARLEAAKLMYNRRKNLNVELSKVQCDLIRKKILKVATFARGLINERAN